MQSRNGGWGAFDKDNTKHLLNKIPFADLEALIDPPTADLTGRMLELMGTFGYSREYPAAVRALRFLKENQEPVRSVCYESVPSGVGVCPPLAERLEPNLRG